VAETALTLEQIAAQKEAADRDRQRQLEWAVVIQRQLDSGCAGDATLVPPARAIVSAKSSAS
jgi:hypothetical protein